MSRAVYSTDLTEAEWQILEPLVPPVKPGGRPAKYSRRKVVNAIRYVLRAGCAWRLLPHDLPPWQSVYHYFWVWRRDGTWQWIHDALLPTMRRFLGRQPSPSGAIIDSQSVKTVDSRCPAPHDAAVPGPPAQPQRGHHRQPVGEDHGKRGPRGYDAGKKVKGRKRHIVVDTQGLLLAVAVHPADVQDRDGAKLVISKLTGRFPRLSLIWADGGYAGKLIEWVATLTGWTLEIVRRPGNSHSFEVLPRRWVVERTFAWLGRHRRLSKDYEALPETTEAWVYTAMTGLMLRRLARPPAF